MDKFGIAKPIQPTYRLFQGNYRELTKALTYYEESLPGARLWSNASVESLYIIEEITRLFHNFVASAMTLVDHTRNRVDDLATAVEWQPFIEEYSSEIKTRFEQNANHQLVQGFRVYILHADLVPTFKRRSWNRYRGEERAVVIETKPLLGWTKWKPLARKKLMQMPRGIHMRQFADEYYVDVKSFNDWIWQKQTELLQNGVIGITD